MGTKKKTDVDEEIRLEEATRRVHLLRPWCDAEDDARAQAVAQYLSDLARDSSVRYGLNPGTNLWLSEAIQEAAKVDTRNRESTRAAQAERAALQEKRAAVNDDA